MSWTPGKLSLLTLFSWDRIKDVSPVITVPTFKRFTENHGGSEKGILEFTEEGIFLLPGMTTLVPPCVRKVCIVPSMEFRAGHTTCGPER
jgi:hypothetical protein